MGFFLSLFDWLTPAPASNIMLNSKEEKPKKKTWNINMKPYKKLVLIKECCKYKNEYRPNNKEKFWFMIGKLLKKKIDYKLVYPIQIITQCVKARIDELIKKKIGSDTEVKQDDFKTIVEQFAKQIKVIARKIDNPI